MQRELDAFAKLPAEEQKRRELERQAMLKMQRLIISEPKNWFNKMINMSEEEIELLPTGFVKKYGSYLNFLQRQHRDAQLSENQTYMGYYE